jgi:hypothetical protein
VSRTVCILALIILAACDDSFSPIRPSALQFSIYGALDASADTQWIRVMPIRATVLTSPHPLGATVSVEQLGSGRTIELRDSVFHFREGYNQDVGSEGIYLHNYWTTERIEPDATYRFTAAREGGPPSQAEIQIPPDFHLAEVWLRQIRTDGPDLVRVDGVQYVPFVGVVNHFYDSCGPGVERLFRPAAARDPADPLVPIARLFQGREGCTRPVVERRELLVVRSGAEWPSGLDYSAGRLGLTDAPSNLSNAMGFLGGVLTRSLPYENCEIESVPPSTDYCRLRYDETSVTLSGVLRELRCGNAPVRSATVRLREIDPPPGAPRRIRFTLSDHLGHYEIGALEAGKRYTLSVHRTGPDGFEEYADHRETLTFTPGERVTRDITLERLGSCSETL